MKIINDSETILSSLCKSHEKWGMYFSFSCEASPEEFRKAAPYLATQEFQRSFVSDFGYVLFDTEEEMWNLYNQTVGDDGPTKLNSYNGPACVYALTCDPQGNPLTENT